MAKHTFKCFEKRKGEDGKKQILWDLLKLINNLLAIYGYEFFVVCNFSYLEIVDITTYCTRPQINKICMYVCLYVAILSDKG